jgi:phosphoesterase RecJ-like protein
MDNKFYSEPNDEFVSQFKSKTLDAKSIVIASHIAPDEDSISSVLATHYYLTEVLKIDRNKVRILYTWEKVDNWNYFKRFSEIEFVDDIYKHIEGDDLVIFTDGSGWKRFSRIDDVRTLQNYVMCIDHHPTPEDKFNLHLVGTQYSSTAEIIYKLFFENEKLDKEICEIILMGILGDTGNFRFVKPDQAGVFIVAERLVREGKIIVESLQSKYQSISIPVYKTLQELMKNSRIEKVNNWPEFLVAYVTPEFIKENNLTDAQLSQSSGIFTPYLKGLKGIEWGVVVTPRLEDGSCKLSFRSIPNSVSVRDLAERMKIGGGHDRAAGAAIRRLKPEEAINILKDWMSANEPVIV